MEKFIYKKFLKNRKNYEFFDDRIKVYKGKINIELVIS